MMCVKRCSGTPKKIMDINYCTYSVCEVIRDCFKVGDIIGLTFIENGVASIATGEYLGMHGGVVKVKNLLLDDTTSYVPLNDVSSVEKGIALGNKNPLRIKLK